MTDLSTMADAMVYHERINTLNGEPGGGKTWVALHTCAEAIAAGHHVLFIDLEDHPGSTAARLLGLGADREDIRQRFHYVKPKQPMSAEAMAYIEGKIRSLGIMLVVFDSVGELMALQGVKPNDDDAVARMFRAILRRIAALGPAVLLLDHVPKNNENSPLYGIGSQRKKAAVDGAMYMVETIKPFSADTPGKVVLRTAKDRNGWFTAGHVAAEVDVVPGGDGIALRLDVAAPKLMGETGQVRQTVNMSRISDYLGTMPERRSYYRDIERNGGVSKLHVNTALTQLCDEGWVVKGSEGDGKRTWYRLARPFDEHAQNAMDAALWTPEDEF